MSPRCAPPPAGRGDTHLLVGTRPLTHPHARACCDSQPRGAPRPARARRAARRRPSSQIPSLVTAELVGALGVDFVCVEGEHFRPRPRERPGLRRRRPPRGGHAGPRPRRRQRNCRDRGRARRSAAGVIVPRVDLGRRGRGRRRPGRLRYLRPRCACGIGPSRATGHGRTVPEYFGSANAAIAVGAQIETTAAVDDADAITRVDGLDFVFVGPGDLAASLGVPSSATIGLAEAVRSVLAAAHAADQVPAGVRAPRRRSRDDGSRRGSSSRSSARPLLPRRRGRAARRRGRR